MKKLLFIIAASLVMLLIAAPVMASTITGATYHGVLTLTNTGTSVARVAVPFTLSTTQMYDNGYINSGCTNTAFQVNGADVAYQPAASGTSTWNVFVSNTVPKGTLTVQFYTGGPDMSAKIRMFPGATGYQNVGAFTLSSNSWEIEIKGWFDLSQTGNFVNLVNVANHITVARASSSSITAEIHSGANSDVVTAAALTTTAEHTLKVTSTAGVISIFWDAVLKDSIARTADFAAIDIPAAAGQYLTGNVMPYAEYIKFTIGAALVQHIIWENSATVFNDQTVNNNDMTPTFRSASSDADVSGAITSFEPVNQASAGEGTGEVLISDAPDQVSGGMYNEGNTAGIVGIAPLIDPALSTALIPKEIFWFPIVFALSIAGGFIAYGFTRTIIVQAAVSGVIYALFVGGGALGDGLIPWSGLIIFILEAVLVFIIQEKYAT
jgi:hypothetical protein